MRYLIVIFLLTTLSSICFSQRWGLEFSGGFGKTFSDETDFNNYRTSFGVWYFIGPAVSFNARLDNEYYHGTSQASLSMFSVPLSVCIHPGKKIQPFVSFEMIPSFPLNFLVARKIFLSLGASGGLRVDINRVVPFIQFEYCWDITGFEEETTVPFTAPQPQEHYLNRYYFSMGLAYQLQQ